MNYTDMESKVREATNDEAWGPTGQLMQELAQATFSYEYFPEVMSMLWRRMLIDNQTNWRRTYKSLVVLNYLIRNGAERVVTSSREHIYDLKSLENYAYIDENGKDQGINVRVRVKQLIEFIQDDDVLREERKKAKKNRDKYVGVASDGSSSVGKLGLRFNDSFSDSVSKFDDNELTTNKPKENKQTKTSSTNVSNKAEANNNTVKSSTSTKNGKSYSTTNSKENITSTNMSQNLFDEPVILDNKPNDVVTTEPAVLDLFSDFDNFGQSTKTDQTVSSISIDNNSVQQKPQSLNEEADLKEIVKNIDIFSNKRPKPVKTNKSNIPDLTLKNPNAVAKRSTLQNTTSKNEKKTVPIESSTNIKQAKSSLNDLDDSLFSTPTASNLLSGNTPKVIISNKPTVSSEPPVDEFDLLSINLVPSFKQTQQSKNDIKSTIVNKGDIISNNPSSNKINDISTLNLVMDNNDPFGLNQMPTLLSTNSNNLTSTLAPIQHQTLGPISSDNVLCATTVSDKSKVTKLPETWSSLVTGTKFNIDLDNLLRPETKNQQAPSLNQLAKTNKPNNDDLFG